MTRDEQGFTLVELLVATVVTGVIMGAVAAALIGAFRNLDTTQTRMAESHDAQLTSAFFVGDVQSATDVDTTTPTCGATPVNVAVLRWTDQGTANVATYILETADGERRLRRHRAVGASTSEVVVAHHLTRTCASPAADGAVDVTETCTPLATCRPGVTLTLTDESGYRFTLSAERRVP